MTETQEMYTVNIARPEWLKVLAPEDHLDRAEALGITIEFDGLEWVQFTLPGHMELREVNPNPPLHKHEVAWYVWDSSSERYVIRLWRLTDRFSITMK